MLQDPPAGLGDVIRSLGDLTIAFLLLEVTDTFLEDLESILSVLVVQDREVRDAADAGQNGLVFGERVLGAEGSHHGDALTAAKGLEGLMLDVAALHYDGGSLDGAPDHLGATIGKSEGSLATDHTFAVGKHGDDDKGVRVVVPGDGGGVIPLPRHILGVRVLDTVLASVIDGDIDVANVKVDGRDQLSAGNGGDFSKNLGGLPGGISEGSSAVAWSAHDMDAGICRVQTRTYSGPMPRTMCLMKPEVYWQSRMTCLLKISARICSMASGVKSWKGSQTALGAMPWPSRPISAIV